MKDLIIPVLALVIAPFIVYYKAYVINLYLTEFFALELKTIAVFAGLVVISLVRISKTGAHDERTQGEKTVQFFALILGPAYMWVVFQVIT